MFYALLENFEEVLKIIEGKIDIHYYKTGLMDNKNIPNSDSIFRIGFSSKSFSQTESDAYFIIHVYRVKESMMSGERGLETKMYLNNKEITSFLTETKLTCTAKNSGAIQ